jgi:hypothetical protein
MGSRNALFMAGVAALLVAGIAGCGSSGDGMNGATSGEGSTRSNLLSYPAYVEEFRLAVAALEWPQETVKPTKALSSDTADSYEKGAGEGDATAHWMCAWQKEYLTYRGRDAPRAAKALTTYATIQKQASWQRSYSDPHTREVIVSGITKAQLGDASSVEQLYRANCPIVR